MSLSALFGDLPSAVLFDLDGTLVDSAPDLTLATDTMLTALGRETVGEERVRSWVGNGATMLVKRALAGTLDPAAVNAIEESVWRPALDKFFDAYHEVNGLHTVPYPGVEAFLQALHERGCRLGIVTNKPTAFTDPLLEKLGLAHWFDITVSGDTLAVKKPDPAPLLHALASFDVPPAAALMVGDSINDVQAAHAAGMPVVAVSYGYNHGHDISTAGADIVVDSLMDLL